MEERGTEGEETYHRKEEGRQGQRREVNVEGRGGQSWADLSAQIRAGIPRSTRKIVLCCFTKPINPFTPTNSS